MIRIDSEKIIQEKIENFTMEYLNANSTKKSNKFIKTFSNNFEKDNNNRGQIILKSSKINEEMNKIEEKNENFEVITNNVDQDIEVFEKYNLKETVIKKIIKVGNVETKSMKMNDIGSVASKIQNVEYVSNDNSGIRLFQALSEKNEKFVVE